MYEERKVGQARWMAWVFAPILAVGATACGGRADLAEADRDGTDRGGLDSGVAGDGPLRPLDSDDTSDGGAGSSGERDDAEVGDPASDDAVSDGTASGTDEPSDDGSAGGESMPEQPGSDPGTGGEATDDAEPTTDLPGVMPSDDDDSSNDDSADDPDQAEPADDAPPDDDQANDDEASDDQADDDQAVDDQPTDDAASDDDPDPDDPPNADDLPDQDPPNPDDSSNTDDPPDMDDDPPETDDDPPDPDQPPEPPLWLATREPPLLVNVHEPLDSVLEMELAWELDNARPVAADDGTQVVAVDGTWAYLVALTDDGVVATRLDLPSPVVVGWTMGRPLVISESVLYAIDDVSNPTPLAEVGQFYNGSTFSPDGRSMLYSEYVVEQGFDVLTLAVDGSESAPALLGSAYSSPALSTQWSSDSRFVTYGISASEGGGIWLSEPGVSSDVTMASAPDAGYNPNYSISPDARHVLLHGSGDLRLVNLENPSAFDTLGATSLSPGVWSPDGRYVFYAEDNAGRLVPVSSDTVFGTPLEVDELGYGCDHLWLDARRMLHRECQTGGAPLQLFQLGTGNTPTLTTSVLVEDAPSFIDVSPDGQCLASWASHEIRISPLDEPANYTTLRRRAAPDMRHLTWAPDSSGVAWVDYPQGVYFQNISQCVPSGDPVRVVSEVTSQTIAFLAR